MSSSASGSWTITYSNSGISPDNKSFYYDDQVVHWLAANDLPLVNATIGSIDASIWYNTAVAINYAAQAGGCGVMFFVVLVLAHQSKRRTPIYILNVLSLLFGFLRNVFDALYFISPWAKLYPYFSNDFSAIPTSAYTISVLGTIWVLLMTITVNLSLVLQAWTVTKSLDDIYRYAIISTSGLVWFLAVGFQFAEVVINNIAIVQAKYYTAQWVQRGALYMETLSVWYFSIIFTSKLIYTLYYRRKHGWTQWSGVKILAAMGGCTMMVPSCFAILQYVNEDIAGSFPQAGSLTITSVALLLPLSSLWASMAITHEAAQIDTSRLAANSKFNSNASNASNISSCSQCGHCRSKRMIPSARHTEFDDEKDDIYGSHFSPITTQNEINYVSPNETSHRDSTEVDLESMGVESGVRVDKSYSLVSGKNERIHRM